MAGDGDPTQQVPRIDQPVADDDSPTQQVPRINEPLADDSIRTQQAPRMDEPARSWPDPYPGSADDPDQDSWHETRQMPPVEAAPAAAMRAYPEPEERRPRRSRAPWVALVVLLVVVAGVFGWRYVQAQRFEQRLAADNAAARQVVEDYYAALADGNAQAALAAATERPEEASLLTDEVLGSAQEAGGISDLAIGEAELASDDSRRMVGDAGTVPVSYSLGEVPVQVDLAVNREADGWRIASATAQVDLGAEGRSVNGQPAGAQVVALFPGSYTVATASPHVRLDEPELVVTAPDPSGAETQQWAGGQASLTTEGREAVVKAATASLSACLAQKSLTPEGCPIAIETGPAITIDADTIKYSLVGSPWSDAEITLEGDTRARGTIPLAYRIEADAESQGVEGVVRQSYEQETSFIADLTGEEPSITWQ